MNKSNGIGSAGTIFIVFVILKLTNLIAWSWWWVTSPLWIGFVIVILIFLIGGLITLIRSALFKE